MERRIYYKTTNCAFPSIVIRCLAVNQVASMRYQAPDTEKKERFPLGQQISRFGVLTVVRHTTQQVSHRVPKPLVITRA